MALRDAIMVTVARQQDAEDLVITFGGRIEELDRSLRHPLRRYRAFIPITNHEQLQTVQRRARSWYGDAEWELGAADFDEVR